MALGNPTTPSKHDIVGSLQSPVFDTRNAYVVKLQRLKMEAMWQKAIFGQLLSKEGKMKLFELHGEVAIVTGAGSGIGQAIAIGMAEAGADVACFGHLSNGGLDQTAERIRDLGRKALTLEGTVTSTKDLSGAIRRIEEQLGPLTVAVNNAGIGAGGEAETLELESWQRVYDVNVTGIFLSCQAQARVMLPRRKGAIINIASISGSIVNRDLGPVEIHREFMTAAQA